MGRGPGDACLERVACGGSSGEQGSQTEGREGRAGQTRSCAGSCTAAVLGKSALSWPQSSLDSVAGSDKCHSAQALSLTFYNVTSA